jgi:hypothetical protein
MLVFRFHALLVAVALRVLPICAQETSCRQDTLFHSWSSKPHQAGYWQSDFPFSSQQKLNGHPPIGLCEGTITVREDGQICIQGRVSYSQLQERLGKTIWGVTNPSISIAGHLISGTGYVMYGRQTRRLYDFVRSYTVEGVSYNAGADIYDNLGAASRGTIDGVCLDSSFVQQEEWYSIAHERFATDGSADIDRMLQANLVLMSSIGWYAEKYEPAEPAYFTGHSLVRLVMRMVQEVPESFYTIIPGLEFTGPVRQLMRGPLSTAIVPQPLLAPEDPVEGLQIDVSADKLKLAMENGLFIGDDGIPHYMFAMIKPIPASDNPLSCWKGPTVALDIQAPAGWGNQLDTYVDEVVYPHLITVNATLTLHLGKRLPPNSRIVATALTTYESCGMELNVDANPCYHPLCKRTVAPNEFEYPPAYYT